MTMMETQMMTMMMIAERAPPGLSSRLHWVDFVRTDGNCDYKAKEEVNMTINIITISIVINNIKYPHLHQIQHYPHIEASRLSRCSPFPMPR